VILKFHLARTNGTKFFHAEKGSCYIIEDGLLERYVWFVLNLIPGRLGFYFQVSLLTCGA